MLAHHIDIKTYITKEYNNLPMDVLTFIEIDISVCVHLQSKNQLYGDAVYMAVVYVDYFSFSL